MNQAAQSDAPAPRPRLGRRWNSARFQGIRFRLGTAMALALLPILILIVIQTQADFRRQADDRRTDLQLAAERSAGSAKARLDSAQVLLRALSPDALGPYCAPRLTALVDRLEGYEGLYRLSPTGEAVCSSGRPEGLRSGVTPAAGSTWFQRLRRGEDLVVVRAPVYAGYPAALIVAIRAERPMGRFDGAMAAVIPLSALQPDTRDPALPDQSEAALTDAAGRCCSPATPPPSACRTGATSPAGWSARETRARPSSRRRTVKASAATTPERFWPGAISTPCCRRRRRGCCPGRGSIRSAPCCCPWAPG
ncbi:hypothetical protein [Brevundimonas aurantiaca]|uniref:hypothetical protein n=1 Tax=Brevundimonas aurantiaca TaxID=74316 RepID=UPI0027956BDD|nr:hypothetical protein [Brevundimonas aurantiaca]